MPQGQALGGASHARPSIRDAMPNSRSPVMYSALRTLDPNPVPARPARVLARRRPPGFAPRRAALRDFRGDRSRPPDGIALITAGGKLTYAELDQRAEALARGLVRQGIGPGQVVGLWLPRGCELLISQIAIAKTGAAWLPFDADAPDRSHCDLPRGCARRSALLSGGSAGRDGARQAGLSGADRGRSRRSDGSTHGRCPRARRDARSPRLSDLHVGLDRHAEGHCDLGPQHLSFSARRQ